VDSFEREAGAYLGTQVATTSSGTAGLVLAMQALGLQPGQKVILPSFTFMATAQAALYAGGIPVFAEIEPDLTLSVADLEQLLDRHDNVGLVVPVHMYGRPAHVSELQQVVDAATHASRPIPVLYDAAHGFGASVNGRKVGSFGSAEVFSLSVTKVLVSVEGGMVSSRDEALISRIRRMRNYGIQANYDAWYPGLNSKMSELHAIVGLHNVRRVPQLMQTRGQLADRYATAVAMRTPFRPFGRPIGIEHTFKDFSILLPPELKARRAELIQFLSDRGVETRAYFSPPVHEQRFFQRYADRRLPLTEDLSRRVLTLPFYTSMPDDEMDYVVDVLEEAAEYFGVSGSSLTPAEILAA
jgi:dTDP-4-amino-4,6-dideoxygalactose transaminase